jgi:hypothetical protein
MPKNRLRMVSKVMTIKKIAIIQNRMGLNFFISSITGGFTKDTTPGHS